MMRPTLSVVVPMYNEAEVLPELFLQTRAVLDGLDVELRARVCR